MEKKKNKKYFSPSDTAFWMDAMKTINKIIKDKKNGNKN